MGAADMISDFLQGASGRLNPRISTLLDEVLADFHQPQRLVDSIILKATAQGLHWRDVVAAVDEAERRTGLTLHAFGHCEWIR
ncbi:MAG TPA: hypothetical protein VK196_12345 [Magnetospirillum sp.]|nr:hypothetical protein [Magnetospirillum sp.]